MRRRLAIHRLSSCEQEEGADTSQQQQHLPPRPGTMHDSMPAHPPGLAGILASLHGANSSGSGSFSLLGPHTSTSSREAHHSNSNAAMQRLDELSNAAATCRSIGLGLRPSQPAPASTAAAPSAAAAGDGGAGKGAGLRSPPGIKSSKKKPVPPRMWVDCGPNMMMRVTPKLLETGATKGSYIRRLSIPRSFLLKCFPHVQGDCSLKLQVKVPREAAASAMQLAGGAGGLARAGGRGLLQQAWGEAAAQAAAVTGRTAARAVGGESWAAAGEAAVEDGTVIRAHALVGKDTSADAAAKVVSKSVGVNSTVAASAAAAQEAAAAVAEASRCINHCGAPPAAAAVGGRGGLGCVGASDAPPAAAMITVLEVVGHLRCTDGPNKTVQDCSRIYMTHLDKKLDPFVQWRLLRLEQVRLWPYGVACIGA